VKSVSDEKIPLLAMQALMGRGDILILDLGTRRERVVSVTPRIRFIPGKEPLYPMEDKYAICVFQE
jgi:hypothetical protein